jgi:hypothetical protein
MPDCQLCAGHHEGSSPCPQLRTGQRIAIVARALAHAKEERFASALAMKEALEKREPPEKPGLLKRIFGS